jgi:phospho-N-acetylmuramoyl-pentapeptide-transferase
MLYHLLYPLHDVISFLNVFKYITFRAACACVTAFLIVLVFGPVVIRKLTELKVGQNIRDKEESVKLYDLHKQKQNTPTMGGLLVLLALMLATILWSDLTNTYVLLAMLSTVWLGFFGFADDYLKLKSKSSRGLGARAKLLGQIALGLFLGAALFLDGHNTTKLDIPFFKDIVVDLGPWYLFFIVLVIAGSSNAVNLTDGLDGLAIGSVIMVAFTFAALCYVSGNAKFANYLFIPYIPAGAELTIFCAAILGASLGFLWFNCYPASVFMGDVGSLALGGALGTVAVLIKKELLLGIVGGVFVIEVLSVMLQVGSFKLRKKRIFKIAPLHHHFQFLGWSETKVIVRFWILAALFALLTLVTLKIR